MSFASPKRAMLVCRFSFCLPILAGLFMPAFLAAQTSKVGISDDLRAAIISQGPWPPERVADPSNRFSDNKSAATLGIRLFFDPRLSPDGSMSCATCHRPEMAFAERLTTSQGRVPLSRNTPSLTNVRFRHWFGRDGGSDSLWAASIRPILNQDEFAASASQLAALIENDRDLREAFIALFGSDPAERRGDRLLANIGKALAAFQETLISNPSDFDRFRDAVAAKDHAAIESYPAPAKRGANIFFGRGQCNICHFGPLFTNGEFGDVGVSYFVDETTVDPGRHQGIKRVKALRFNLLGKHNDDPEQTTAAKTRYLDLHPRNFGEFSVPSLRGVSQTAPYMHNGSLATLEEVVRHYSELDSERVHAHGRSLLSPLNLTEQEIVDLVAFLETL